MEKIKWIILAVLLLVMVFVIFRSPKVEEEVRDENHINITISINNFNTETSSTIKIEEGDYVLYLDEFQYIEGKGTGWHISFTRPSADREMIVQFDAVDTSGHVFSSEFPQEIVYSLQNDKRTSLKHAPLLRGSFNVGYKKRITQNTIREEMIPMPEFRCLIDTAWTSDSTGGIQMSFQATHSDLLRDVFGMQYSMSGKVQIENAPLIKRTIQ